MSDTPPVQPRSSGIAAFLAKVAGFFVILILAGLLVAFGVQRYVRHRLSPDPTTIATASLAGLREQNRLSAFAARFVSVTTSRQSQFGLSTEKTMIMPGMVRYEVDLGRLNQNDVLWDAATKTLAVRLPPIEVTGPQVDMTAIREYGSGGVLARLTDAGQRLDEANRRAGQAELLRQAQAAPMLKIARDATRRAVERSFAMPLRAAGIDAKVAIVFPGEALPGNEHWDMSRTLSQVIGNGS